MKQRDIALRVAIRTEREAKEQPQIVCDMSSLVAHTWKFYERERNSRRLRKKRVHRMTNNNYSQFISVAIKNQQRFCGYVEWRAFGKASVDYKMFLT